MAHDLGLRELAVQIAKDAKGLCLALRIRLACLFGGTSKGEQVKSLDQGVDLIVATPGRLDDLVSQPDRFTGRDILWSYMAQYRSFRQPTPIQAYCWPAACAGRNILGISKTGSGKTLAFLCPGLARVLSFRSSPTPSFGPYVLVIAPT
ncbi:ATP-dependent RNA helicase DBP3, partial [Symbiodinium microadriaticum]